MLKKYPIIKWSLISIVSLVTILVAFGFWFMSLIPKNESKANLPNTQPGDLEYLHSTLPLSRGKILMVVTSHDQMTETKSTGYELTELARPYYVFQTNGFEVDIASPKGGEPPVVIDWEDMGAYDFAFLNDSSAQRKVKNSIPVGAINSSDYEAVFFAGGKGAVFDFPQNKDIQRIIRDRYENGKVVAAVCHGPAALVNVTLKDGTSLAANKKICGFTNEEELFLIPDAEEIFPFLLQDELTKNGAHFQEGALYLQNVAVDGNLITGQNPWSTWAVAETVIKKLGYAPVKRELTDEENSILVLNTYHSEGYHAAQERLSSHIEKGNPISHELIAVHSIVVVMQWEIGKAVDMIRLLRLSNSLS